MKGADIQASVPPANIQMELADNEDLRIPGPSAEEKVIRRFTYVGTQQGSNVPTYIESIDQDGYRVEEPIITASNG